MKLHLKRTLTFWWKDVEVRGIMYSKLQCSFEMYTVEQLEFQNIHNESIAVLKLNARTKLQTIIVIKEGKNLLKRENLILKEKLLLLQYAINNQHYQKLFITSTQLLDMRDKKKYPNN